MAELIACYIFTTWLLEAFNVIGFLWPNGDRGSGKTQLLIIVAELAYLGQVILAGGSFASLRDMADYGACLAFDDAENCPTLARPIPTNGRCCWPAIGAVIRSPLRNPRLIAAGARATSTRSARVYFLPLVSPIPFWQVGQSLCR